MPSVMKLKLGRHWTFQQDNDPKNTSTSNKAWFQKKKWKILEWPSQLPDLNPINNLWWDLKKAVANKPNVQWGLNNFDCNYIHVYVCVCVIGILTTNRLTPTILNPSKFTGKCPSFLNVQVSQA